MYSEIQTDCGIIKVSDTVLAKVVSDILTSSYGVVGLTYRNAADGLNTLLHKEKMFKGVVLSKKANGVVIELNVVLEHGVSIPTLTENLAETIKYRTEKITGVKVIAVNINVQGLRI